MTIRPLPSALQLKANNEINENAQRVSSDIKDLKEWLQKQPHLHSLRPTDQWLLAFLRGCKFSLERSKEKLDFYYTLKAIVPEFFMNRDPSDTKIQEILKLGVFLPVKRCHCEDSTRICIFRLEQFDPSKYHLADIIKVSLMITEILMLEDDNFTVSGEDVILDLKGAGVSAISQWTPSLAKKAVSCFEMALPVRVRSNHFINTPKGFETAFALLKTFLGEKFKNRVQVHNRDYDKLYKVIPRSVLPVEYGGDDGTVQELTDHWKNKVESYRNWFLQEGNATSDESKRVGPPKTSPSMFGVEGSFRKLEVD